MFVMIDGRRSSKSSPSGSQADTRSTQMVVCVLCVFIRVGGGGGPFDGVLSTLKDTYSMSKEVVYSKRYEMN